MWRGRFGRTATAGRMLPSINTLELARFRAVTQRKERESMSKKLFVGSLSWDTTDDGLRAAFEQFGEVSEAIVIRDRMSGRSRGFGFVTFEDSDAAERAVAELNNTELDGRPIKVDVAQERNRDR